MSFDLPIAVKRDPVKPASDDTPPPRTVSVSLAVAGEFAEAGELELMRRVHRSFDEGADTVIIDMQQVLIDVPCLERLAAAVMAERAAGRHVQVAVRDASLHATCASIAGSRDWLIAYTGTEPATKRRAVHLDSGRDDPSRESR